MRRMRRSVAAAALLGAVAALLVVPAGTAGGQSGTVGYTYAASFRGTGILCDSWAVDLATAEATVINTDPVPCNDGLAFAPDGTLYGFRVNLPSGPGVSSQLVTIDPSNGTSTVIGDLPQIQTGGMTFDGAGSVAVRVLTERSRVRSGGRRVPVGGRPRDSSDDVHRWRGVARSRAPDRGRCDVQRGPGHRRPRPA